MTTRTGGSHSETQKQKPQMWWRKSKRLTHLSSFFWTVYRVDSRSLHLCADNKYQIQIHIHELICYIPVWLTQSFCSVQYFAAGASCQPLDKLVCDLLSQCIFCELHYASTSSSSSCGALVFSFLFLRSCFIFIMFTLEPPLETIILAISTLSAHTTAHKRQQLGQG